MKLLFLSLVISALLVANTTNSKACVVEVFQSLHQQSETRDVKNFHAISSSGSYTVNVMMGEDESLSIQGNAEDINKIETVVENTYMLSIKVSCTLIMPQWSRFHARLLLVYAV